MKKDKHFRAIMATCLCFLLAILVWWRVELSVVQIGCFVVMLLAGLTLVINNHRNEGFHHAASIPFIAAVLVYIWSDTRTLRGSIFCLPITLYCVWIAMKPYYIKWKKSQGPANGSSESPVEFEGKSNGC